MAISQLGGLAVTLALTPIQLHRMGGERYGLLTVFAALGGLLGFIDYGTSWAAFYYLPKLVREGIAPVATLRSLRRLSILLAAVAALVWLVGVGATVGRFRIATMSTGSLLACSLVAGAVTSTSIVSNVRISVVRSLGLFKYASAAAALNVALINVVWATVAGRSWDVHAVLATQVLSNLMLALVWSTVTRLTVARHDLAAGAEPTSQEIVSFAMTGSASAAGQSALLGADKVALAAVGGLSGLPAYSIPFAMASRVNLVGASLSTVLFPRLGGDRNEESRSSDNVLALWSAAVTIAISGVLSTSLLIAGPHFFELWLGGAIGRQAGGPVRALAIGFFFFTVGQIGYAVNDANGGIRRTAIAFLAGGSVAPIVIGLAAWSRGIVAGAYASAACIGLVGLGGMHLGRKSLPVQSLFWSLLAAAIAITVYLGFGLLDLPRALGESIGVGIATVAGTASLVSYWRRERRVLP